MGRAWEWFVAALDTVSVVESCTPERSVSTGIDDQRWGLRWHWQLAAIFLTAALVICRQPDVVSHPQFFGEDGHVWFADAYNHGWFTALFRTQDGYYQTLPRLAAALALLFPLALGPLVMNLAGLAIQILPVPVLLSARMAAWGSLPFRAVLAFVYVALPNSREVNVTVTEAQWHLALVGCLLVLAEAPQTKIERLFDIAVFALCGLTGPFCIVLLPVALLFWWLRTNRWTWVATAVLAFGACIQVTALFHGGASRGYKLPLGAGFEELARILGGQVYAAAVVGSNSLASLTGPGILIAVAILGTALLVYAVYCGTLEYRLFVFVSILLFAASLASPMPGWPKSANTAWEFLAGRPAIHYWFFPTLAFLWGVIGLLVGPKRNQASQAIAIFLVLLMLFGFVRDWRYVPFQDLQFAEYARRFDASKPGTVVVIPETPPGWTLQLVKK